jgi:hypothetical protein
MKKPTYIALPIIIALLAHPSYAENLKDIAKEMNNELIHDWTKIDLEAQRKEKVRESDITINVEIAQRNTDTGFDALIIPSTKRTVSSLRKTKELLEKKYNVENSPITIEMHANDDMLGTFVMRVHVNTEELIEKVQSMGYTGIVLLEEIK